MYGDGSQTRSFCYVGDLVEGFYRLMTTECVGGDVFNLGNENEITIQTSAKTIITVFDTDRGVTYEPLPEEDPERRRPDLSLARQELGYEPSIGLASGLGRTVDYFESVL